jgi:transposase
MAKRTKSLRLAVARLESIVKEYKKENPEKKRDYKTYEQQFARRAKTCFDELNPLIDEAISSIKKISGEHRGNEPKLVLKQKVFLLLLKSLFGKSNRSMEWMIVLFSGVTGVDVSYKTIERLYSDVEVQLALFNLHILILKKKGIINADCSGDGTGYTLTIKEHYASYAERLKEYAKDNQENKNVKEHKKDKKKIKVIYSFALMDIKTRLYIGYGTSFKSEKEAFLNALKIAKETRITIDSLRLDKYYSAEAYVDICQKELGKVKMFLIPKSNVASFGLGEWCRNLHRFMNDTKLFLSDYFQRNQSESGFSEDKKRTGWKITQKINQRIDTAYTLTVLWHNLSWLGAEL